MSIIIHIRLGRYMDGDIYINVTEDEPELFMRHEDDVEKILQNSELCERIFTMFKYKDMSDL